MPWYSKKTNEKGSTLCPVCDGTGVRIDRKTLNQRACVLCKGTGTTETKKGNARVVSMEKYDMDRIMNVIDQTK